MTPSPGRRRALASAATAAVLVAAPLVGAGTAHAQYPPPPPTLTLSSTQVPAGGTLTFHATGFSPGPFIRAVHPAGDTSTRRYVTAELESRQKFYLGRFPVHPDGTVDGTVRIPREARIGLHIFRLVERRPFRSASAPLRVAGRTSGPGFPGRPGDGRHHGRHDRNGDGRNGAPGQRAGLAATGSEKTLALGGTAAGLIAAGGGTLLAVRRRRSS
ncbi:hypothetical protein ACIQ6V_26755 [Streptomyces sp. NPDC096198]|uniref:hypothetical protein n=1 Tax=Streptomyces sp. NPDC096198 TaxID=3366080 RepID=UPI0037F25450